MRICKSIIFLFFCGIVTFALAACNSNQTKDSYVFTYDLNYEGSNVRKVKIQAGLNAVDWKANRDGYILNNWYQDKEGTIEYDFTQKVEKETTVYATWRENLGVAVVTFDFGYDGILNKTLEVEKETLINEKLKPKSDRFGMELKGWYKDEAFTNEWNFKEDTVEENLTLHAKYEYTMKIPKNADGSIKFENTAVYVWNPSANKLPETELKQLIDEFNKQYEGKIVVSTGSALYSQADTFLRIQQTPEQMKDLQTYYPIADIFSFAGIKMSNSDYYEGAINEFSFKGVLLQTPISGVVPYFIYNKNLMQKYNGTKELPTNYSELSALLKVAYEGEKSTNTNFKSILTTLQWMYKESPSFTAFSQNGADYSSFKDGEYFNEWDDAAVFENAKTALKNTYNLFGVNGDNHGKIADYDMGGILGQVSSGNSLIGMISWNDNISSIANDNNVGILPMSGLFTDNEGEERNRVPIHTVGIGFYNKATNITTDPLRVCAAAIFADYVAKKSYVFSEKGYVPLAKEAQENELYKNSSNKVVKLLQASCKPENYYTLYGSRKLKEMVNKAAAEGVIVPYCLDINATIEDVDKKIRELFAEVAGRVS